MYRLAVGSFVEEYNNKVQIVQLDEETSDFVVRSTFDHPYPTTKIMWIPDSVSKIIMIVYEGGFLYIHFYNLLMFLLRIQNLINASAK